MILIFLIACFLFTSAIDGTELDYKFNNQADGWLKLYKEPMTWNDANIRCDSEGSVLASPLSVQLRDGIKNHLLRLNETVSTIYTGVHAEFTNGDFLSVEGVPMSSLPVPLLRTENIEYTSSESCIVWDTTNEKLRKVKCETKLPYICYKKRNTAQIPSVDTGAGTTDSGSTLSYTFDSQTGWGLKMHQPDTWTAALNRCAAEGAVLASPLTTQLNDAIKAYVQRVNPSVSSIYTGVHANFSNGDFYSSEGVSLTKMPVSLDSSANIVYNSSESCVVMNTFNTVVTSVRCTERYPYVCLKKRSVIRGCGVRIPGYTYEPRTESCYKFHNQGQTWTSAYNTCHNEGGYLAIIKSQLESVALKELFAKYPDRTISGYYLDAAYIGRRDWLDGKSWVTVKGESIQQSGFIGWAKTEPNNANGNEYCGTLNRNGFIYDDPCGLKLAFICEKDSEILDSNPNIFSL